MKVLVVSENHSLTTLIKDFCASQNWYSFCYSVVLKAIDNLVEINPELIIINGVDFPRHWKIVVQHIKQYKSLQTVKVALIVDSHFNKNDEQKAEYFDIDCMLYIDSVFSEKKPFDTLLSVFEGASSLSNTCKNMYNNNATFSIYNFSQDIWINGRTQTLSADELVGEVDSLDMFSGLLIGENIGELHININDKQFCPLCAIKQISEHHVCFRLLWNSKIERKFFSSVISNKTK